MTRTYQTRRRKAQSNKPSKDQLQFSEAYTFHAQYASNNNASKQAQPAPSNSKTNMDINTNTNAKTINKYHRKSQSKSPPKPLTTNLSQTPPKKCTQTKHTYNLRSKRITTQNINDDNNSDTGHTLHKKQTEDEKKYRECNNRVSITANTIDTTTSFLSALSLRSSTKKTKTKTKTKKKPIIIDNETELTLDDICDDGVDISEQYFDPESIAQHSFSDEDINTEWPSWVSKDMIKRSEKQEERDSPSRKRKRIGNKKQHQIYGSPPSKKLKSPQKKEEAIGVYSTVRKNKKRGRRRSSLRSSLRCSLNLETPKVHRGYNDVETPIASIRTQRIHRLTRKSNTDLLFLVLLREGDECDEVNAIKKELKMGISRNRSGNGEKLGLKDLNGLHSVGKMDDVMSRLCIYLLSFGADALWLNKDGLSAIYIAMHYDEAYAVISEMMNKCCSKYEELNQTYIFASHGTLSLLDIALRVGDVACIKLLLENGLMPTQHSINCDDEAKVELIAFCKQHGMCKLVNTVLKQQLFEAIENFDIEYVESILCHGMDVNIKVEESKSKSSLYYLVQQSFDIYDDADAKDQYETIVCLLKHGANPNCLDATMTPMLIYPMQRSGGWNIKLVDILLHYGANLKVKVAHTAKTLYAYAKENCVCDEILKLITTYYNNNNNKQKSKAKAKAKAKPKAQAKATQKCKKSKKPKSVANTIELNVTSNEALTSIIKTKNVVTKSYQRNFKRKSAKIQ